VLVECRLTGPEFTPEGRALSDLTVSYWKMNERADPLPGARVLFFSSPRNNHLPPCTPFCVARAGRDNTPVLRINSMRGHERLIYIGIPFKQIVFNFRKRNLFVPHDIGGRAPYAFQPCRAGG
jgi:hypothetical protein